MSVITTATAGRMKYTREDDRKMLEFLVKELQARNPDALEPKGFGLWKKAEEKGIFKHTCDSLSSHFRKVLFAQIPKTPLMNREDREFVMKKLRIKVTASETNVPTASSANKSTNKSKKTASADENDGWDSTDELFRSPRPSKSVDAKGAAVNRPKVADSKQIETCSAYFRNEIPPRKNTASSQKVDAGIADHSDEILIIRESADELGPESSSRKLKRPILPPLPENVNFYNKKKVTKTKNDEKSNDEIRNERNEKQPAERNSAVERNSEAEKNSGTVEKRKNSSPSKKSRSSSFSTSFGANDEIEEEKIEEEEKEDEETEDEIEEEENEKVSEENQRRIGKKKKKFQNEERPWKNLSMAERSIRIQCEKLKKVGQMAAKAPAPTQSCPEKAPAPNCPDKAPAQNCSDKAPAPNCPDKAPVPKSAECSFVTSTQNPPPAIEADAGTSTSANGVHFGNFSPIPVANEEEEILPLTPPSKKTSIAPSKRKRKLLEPENENQETETENKNEETENKNEKTEAENDFEPPAAKKRSRRIQDEEKNEKNEKKSSGIPENQQRIHSVSMIEEKNQKKFDDETKKNEKKSPPDYVSLFRFVIAELFARHEIGELTTKEFQERLRILKILDYESRIEGIPISDLLRNFASKSVELVNLV